MDDNLIARANAEMLLYRTNPETSCKICKSTAMPFDMVDILKQCEPPFFPIKPAFVPVIYHRCEKCGFIFTTYFDEFDDYMWRKYIYNSDYIKADPEYLDIRPKNNAFFIDTLLSAKKVMVIGLDYGGGNGVTANALRKLGYQYDSYDPYGEYSICNELVGSYNFCSAIEVLEHTIDPIGLMENLLKLTTRDKLMVIIGTSTSDHIVTNKQRLSWWYAAPRNGHVSLFSKKTLSILASQFGLGYHSFSPSVHILTRNMSDKEVLYFWIRGRISRKLKTIKKKILEQ